MLWVTLPVILGLVGSLMWIGFFVVAAWHRNWRVRVSGLSVEAPPGGWPSVAIVFAARDEEAVVEAAARSILAIDYPNSRVVAVDDRSEDATGRMLEEIATETERMRVVHVERLPEGWLGKTHALQVGASAVSADWLLFTDADVHFAPDVLRRVVGEAVRRKLDHVTVTPDVPTESVGEQLFLIMFQLGLSIHSPGWRIGDPRNRAYLGIGAFNLVRREAFEALGGLSRIALSVDDDMQLGRLIKWSGRRSEVFLGNGAISVRWQTGLSGMIRGMEKNFFAGSRFSLSMVMIYAAGLLVMGLGPFVGLMVGPLWSRVVCGVAVAIMVVLMPLIGKQSGLKHYHAVLVPLSAVVCAFALLRSTWLTLTQRGIRWRGHLYPLDQLRAHVRKREAWMHELWGSTR